MFDCAIFNKYKTDILLMLILFAIGAGSFAGYRILTMRNSTPESKVIITRADEVIGEYQLSDDAKVELLYMDSFNRLVIKGGSVWIEDAGCPDRICVNRGKISRVGESIVCLPNKLVIYISGDEEEKEYDAIVN